MSEVHVRQGQASLIILTASWFPSFVFRIWWCPVESVTFHDTHMLGSCSLLFGLHVLLFCSQKKHFSTSTQPERKLPQGAGMSGSHALALHKVEGFRNIFGAPQTATKSSSSSRRGGLYSCVTSWKRTNGRHVWQRREPSGCGVWYFMGKTAKRLDLTIGSSCAFVFVRTNAPTPKSVMLA